MSKPLSTSREDFIKSYLQHVPYYTKLQQELHQAYHEQDGSPTVELKKELLNAYKDTNNTLKKIKNIDDAKKSYLSAISRITINQPARPVDFVPVYIRDYLQKSYGSALDNLPEPVPKEGAAVPPSDLAVLKVSKLNYSLALDDLNNPMSHLYYPKTSYHGRFSGELKNLGKQYGFKAIQVPAYDWTEDNLWLSDDGQLAFQPKTPLSNKKQYGRFVTALKNQDIPGSEEEGHHSLGLESSQGLGQSTLDKADDLVKSRGIPMVKTFSVIDGGNMLTGLRANGTPYVLIGRDAVLQTTLVQGYLDQERIAKRLADMHAGTDFSLTLKAKTTDWGYSYYEHHGHDPNVDLMLLDTAKIVPEGLSEAERLEFAKLARARANLVRERNGSKSGSDKRMILSAEQRGVITQRYEELQGVGYCLSSLI